MSLALFFTQYVSQASTFIFRSLRLCVGVLLCKDRGYRITPAELHRNANSHRTRYVVTHTYDIRILSKYTRKPMTKHSPLTKDANTK